MSWWSRFRGLEENAHRGALRTIQFDTTGWKPMKVAADVLEWRDDLNNRLRVGFYARPADSFGEQSDIASLRALCRLRADAGGGAIVSVETATIAGIRCPKVINKYERRPGYEYDGAIIIPLRDSHFEIIMNATEHGTTGVREAVVTNQLLAMGELDLSGLKTTQPGPAPIPGWFVDPYDRGYDGRVLHSPSDDSRLDALFPDHPLSRVRLLLDGIERSVKLDVSAPATYGSPGPNDDGASEGPTAPLVSVEAVAKLYFQAGRYDQVEQLIIESLRQRETHAEVNQSAMANEAVLLGFAYERRGNLAGAENAFRRANASFASAVGAGHPNAAQAATNVGRMLIAQGKHAEAEPLLRGALKLFETAEDSGSSAGVALNGLGLIYIARELYSDAILCFDRAIAIFERVHGPVFPDVVTVLRNVALCWKRLGNMERMAEAWQRAERIDRGQRSGSSDTGRPR
jgi:tetratricopeptide repeat protein